MALTYVALASVTVGSGGASTITFNNIPGTYTDLIIKTSLRDTTGAVRNAGLRLIFNGSGTSYSSRWVYGEGSFSGLSGNDTSSGWIRIGQQPGANATSNTFSSDEIYIPNYAGSSNKSVSADSVGENNATEAAAYLVAGLWSNTSAITKIEIQSNSTAWAQHSTATLYGIKNS